MRFGTPPAAAALLLLAAAACDHAQSLAGPDAANLTAVERAAAVPERDDPWRATSTAAMWAHISRHDTTVSLGVKLPGGRRGVYEGRWLVDEAGWRGALRALEGQPGVQVRAVDGHAPLVLLSVASPEALERVRRLPFADYVEPAVLNGVPEAPRGPSMALAPGVTALSSSSGGDPNYGYYVDSQGSHVPNIFTGMRIPEAWQWSTGAGVTIGLIDTGVDVGNPLLTHWQRYQVYYPDALDDFQGHGTHMAGVISGKGGFGNVRGVAYGAAGYVSVKHSNSYLDVNAWRTNAAMDTAVAHGAKVINMSFRSDNGSNAVSDRISMYYSGTDAYGARYDVLFVAAAGSGGQVADYWYGVIFPASHPDVIAVSAINYDNLQLYSGSHSGYQVELSAYHGQPTVGTNDEGYWNADSGNSSNASAIVSGIATLVRAKYPTFRNTDIRTRLRRGARDLGPLGRDSEYGYGIVNALAAVGGFYQATLKGAAWHDECAATTVRTRTCRLIYSVPGCFDETLRVVANGDGPFTYQWSTGSTGSSTVVRLCNTFGEYGYTVTVNTRDTRDGTTYTHTAHIMVKSSTHTVEPT